MLAILAIPAGLLIGLSLGALGGGGSILTVPALVYLLHQQPHNATTASLLIVGITSLAGMAAHWRAGRVRLAQGLTFGALGIAGSYVGTRLSASVRPDLLLALFAVLVLVAAVAMLRRRRAAGTPAPAGAAETAEGPDPEPEDDSGRLPVSTPSGKALATTLAPQAAHVLTGQPIRRRVSGPGARQALKVVAAATTVGLLTGFFGVGGGFVIVPALVLALGFDMASAVGTSLLVIAINSAASLTARFGEGIHLNWTLMGVFTLAALFGTLGGNHLASRVSASKLTVAFAALLFAVAIYTLARSLPALL